MVVLTIMEIVLLMQLIRMNFQSEFG